MDDRHRGGWPVATASVPSAVLKFSPGLVWQLALEETFWFFALKAKGVAECEALCGASAYLWGGQDLLGSPGHVSEAAFS